MKKLIVCLLGLLLLVGCSSKGYSKISNPEDIYDINGKKFTTQDLYSILKVSDSLTIVDSIMATIVENEGIDQSELLDYIDQMIAAYESFGYSGLTLVNARNSMLASGNIELLCKDYVEKNYAELAKEDKPVKLQLASFSTEEEAQAFIDEFNANLGTFDQLAINHGYTSDCSETVYLDSDETLVYDVKDYINNTDKLGISSIITYSTTSEDADSNIVDSNVYYVINIISKNVEDIVDDYIAVKSTSYSEDEVVELMLATHDIQFYDQDIYELMTAEYEVLK